MILSSLLPNAGCKRALDTEPSTQPDAEPVPVRTRPYRCVLLFRRGYFHDMMAVTLNKPRLSLATLKHNIIHSMRTRLTEHERRSNALRGASLIEVFIDNGNDVPLEPLPDSVDIADLAERNVLLRYFVRRELEPGCSCCECGSLLGEIHVATSDPRQPGIYWCFACARKNHLALERTAWDAMSMDKSERVVMLAPVDMCFALHAVVVDWHASINTLKALVCAKLGAPIEQVSGLTLLLNGEYLIAEHVFKHGARVRSGTVKSYAIADGSIVHYALPPVAQ